MAVNGEKGGRRMSSRFVSKDLAPVTQMMRRILN
jgi:hypothetical protein